jgi:hypothetical protein
MVINGVMAIRATIPKASESGFPPSATEAPKVKAKRKELDMGPLATPPESNAIAVKRGGQKNIMINAIRYPGMRK